MWDRLTGPRGVIGLVLLAGVGAAAFGVYVAERYPEWLEVPMAIIRVTSAATTGLLAVWNAVTAAQRNATASRWRIRGTAVALVIATATTAAEETRKLRQAQVSRVATGRTMDQVNSIDNNVRRSLFRIDDAVVYALFWLAERPLNERTDYQNEVVRTLQRTTFGVRVERPGHEYTGLGDWEFDFRPVQIDVAPTGCCVTVQATVAPKDQHLSQDVISIYDINGGTLFVYYSAISNFLLPFRENTILNELRMDEFSITSANRTIALDHPQASPNAMQTHQPRVRAGRISIP